jgi:hypothetical protein
MGDYVWSFFEGALPSTDVEYPFPLAGFIGAVVLVAAVLVW